MEPTDGTPVGIGPQFQRLSELVGDYSFQAQRRQILDKITAPKWTYIIETEVPASVLGGGTIGNILTDTGLTDVPILGSFHASDVFLNWFGTIPEAVSRNTYHLMGVLVAFTHNLDPNTAGLQDVPNWPQYDSSKRQAMSWKEEGDVTVITDNFRSEGIDYLNEIKDSLRI